MASVEKLLVKDQNLKVKLEEGLTRAGEKKWVDIQGNPTKDDTITHWDEEGCLDIREEYDEQVESSGVDTDVETLRSDQVKMIGVPIAKSPADIRKMMEKVEIENQGQESKK